MSTHNVTKPECKLSEPIDRADHGEGVVITQGGEAEREILRAIFAVPAEVRAAAVSDVRRIRNPDEW